MIRLTIAVPQAHTADANDLAMVLGYGPADVETYRNPAWQDAAGNLYAAASLPVSDAFFTAALSALQRPAWDADLQVDMAAAERGQAIINVWQGPGPDPDNPEPVPQASPDRITAVAGLDGLDALEAMDLSPVPQDGLL